MDPAAVFTALAELAPAASTSVLDAVGDQQLVWLVQPHTVPPSYAERLAAVDVLHRDERLLRRGWGFLLGSTEVDGARRRVRLPLLTEPIRLKRSGAVVPAGDLELTSLVEDRDLAAELEALAAAAAVIGDYLAFSEPPPPRPAPADPAHEWTAARAAELRRAGRTVRCARHST
jgi:hypothetical protein